MRSLLFLIVILILGIKFYSIEFLATVLVISFLIFFHELGHFLAARSLGVKVEVFSIGFGKSLIEREFIVVYQKTIKENKTLNLSILFVFVFLIPIHSYNTP